MLQIQRCYIVLTFCAALALVITLFIRSQIQLRQRPQLTGFNYTTVTIVRRMNDTSCANREKSVNKNRRIFQDLLRKWITISAENNVSYVLHAGSLMGHYRTGDFIPWDHDVDVLINASDFTILQKIASPRNFRTYQDDRIRLAVHDDFYKKDKSGMKRYSCNGRVSSYGV